MSEVQKPVVVEEAAAPVVEAAPVEVAPVVEETPVVEAAPVETAPVVEEAATEAKVETPKKEFEGEGTIGYKAPGGFIKKLAGFQKRFFWFGTDAVEVKSLSNYLRGEKPEVGNHNAAWSSQTGKGLLYFSKSGDKSAPVGLINLADISDVKEDGSEFSFVSNGQKHVFQAANVADRDNWVAALKTQSAEAKESAEGITGSDGYKEQLASLSKPAVVAAKVEEKKEDKKEEKAVVEEPKAEEKKEEKKEETKEEKKARTKSRSASRKRNSIFGGFNLGGSKKEEVAAEKVEAKEEAKTEAAPVEAVEPVAAEPVVEAPATETAAVEEVVPEARPAASKRHSSLFDFKSRFGSKKAADATPAVPAKDDEVVTSTEAPVIPAVEQSEPLATSIASPATVPTETVTNGEPAAEVAPVETTKAEKHKSALPFGLGQKKEKSAEPQGEKPLSPFAKLRQTVKGKSSKSAEKPAEATEAPAVAETTEEAKEEKKEETTEEPVVAAAAPIQTSTPVVSATA